MNSAWQVELNNFWAWLDNKSEVTGDWAVGVSGGADSLALVFLLTKWCAKHNRNFTALTVQHGLRPEAEDEAQYVAQLMKTHGIKHQILYWQGDKPSRGIENAARVARYGLMYEWCMQNGASALLIAHHKRDQAETFLMRLQRGSGVDGLSAMAPLVKWKNLYIARPLLQINPEDLKSYLQKQNIAWVEDASNDCEDFLRVKIRKLLPELEANIGLSRERLCNTAMEMARVRDYLEKQTDSFVHQEVKFWGDVGASLSPASLLSLHEEIGLRVLSSLLKKISGKIYPPGMEEVERLWEALHQSDFSGRTLSDCEIFKFQKQLWIVQELKSPHKLSKQAWADFVAAHPEYGGDGKKVVELPYKLRRALETRKLSD